jgi:tRNA(adenine34) deaminase
MHFLDEGPQDSERLFLCLHPVPGWSYNCRQWIADWAGQGIRVLAPDLIGFGKSDKPKREDAHSWEFHCRYLVEWLQRLALSGVTVVAPQTDHPLAQRLLVHAPPGQLKGLLVMPAGSAHANELETDAQHAPYPDLGHRAGERAFASGHMR